MQAKVARIGLISSLLTGIKVRLGSPLVATG